MTENLLPYPSNMKEPEAGAESLPHRCPGCGALLTDEDRFCPECGRLLTEEPETGKKTAEAASVILGVYAGPEQSPAPFGDPLQGLRDTALQAARIRSVSISREKLEAMSEEELRELLEKISQLPVTVMEDVIPKFDNRNLAMMVYAGPEQMKNRGGMMSDGGLNGMFFTKPTGAEPGQLQKQPRPLCYCHECGSPLYARSNYCPECGVRLDFAD